MSSKASKSKASSKSKDKKTDKSEKSKSKDKGSEKKSDKKSKSSKDKKDADKKSDISSPTKSVKSSKSKSKGKDDKKGSSKSKDKKEKEKKDGDTKSKKLDMSMSQMDIQDVLAKDSKEEPILAGMEGVNMGLPNLSKGYEMGGSVMQNQADQMRKQMCMLHKQPLRYFCESCEELICYDCTVMGPHNTQLHRISAIEDAFRFRFENINKTIHQSLVPKRAQLIGQIVRLDHRLDEIRTVKGVIDKDIRTEYAAIMERLRSAEGVKNAVLQHDIAEIQKDITRIDEILMTMEEIVSGDQDIVNQNTVLQKGLEAFGPDQLQFLHKYRQLNDNIDYSVTKHFKVEINVLPNDLPRELAERRVLMDHYEEQRKILKFKDDVIWKLSQELKKKYDYFQDEFDKETRNEMNEWARLVDRYGNELKKFELVCGFCGQHLGDQNINGDCQENTSNVLRGRATASQNSINMGSDLGHVSMYYTDAEPPTDMIGKKRHYFARPSLKGMAPGQNVQNQGETVDDVAKEVAIFKNPESLNAMQKLYTATQIKQMLENQFRSIDINQQGIIRKDDFINLLFELTRELLQPAQVMSIVQGFTQKLDDIVNYVEFLKALEKTPNYVGDNMNFGQQDGAGPHLINAMRDQMAQRIAQMSNKDRMTVEKLRMIAKDQIQSKGTDLGATMQKIATQGSDKITQDEMLIAMSRVNDDIQLGDVKELHRIIVGAAPGSNVGIEDVKVPINEVVQMLTL